MSTYIARFNTQAEVTVYVDVPDDIGEFEREEWAADKAHDVASEYIETWGIHRPVLLGMSLDGIGADEVEPA